MPAAGFSNIFDSAANQINELYARIAQLEAHITELKAALAAEREANAELRRERDTLREIVNDLPDSLVDKLCAQKRGGGVIDPRTGREFATPPTDAAAQEGGGE